MDDIKLIEELLAKKCLDEVEKNVALPLNIISDNQFELGFIMGLRCEENSHIKNLFIKQLDNLIDYLKSNNPYPDTVFIEPSEDQKLLAIELFHANDLSVDGYNGSMGRFARNGMIKQIEEFKDMLSD